MNRADPREQAKQLIREYVAAVNAWDFDRLEQLLDEQAVLELPYVPPGVESRYEGRATMLAFMREVAKHIPSENQHDLKLDTLHDEPGTVIATYKSDMRIDGRPYRNQYVGVFKVHNGRVKLFVEYFDPIKLLVAMGGKLEGGSFGA